MEFLDLRLGPGRGHAGGSRLVLFYRAEVAAGEDSDRSLNEHDDFEHDVTTHIPDFDQCCCSVIANHNGTAVKLHEQQPDDVGPIRTTELFMG